MRVPKAVNAAEYAQSYNEANINDGLNPFYTETEINKDVYKRQAINISRARHLNHG